MYNHYTLASTLNGTPISRRLVAPQMQDTFFCVFTLAKFSETTRVKFWSSNLMSRLNLGKCPWYPLETAWINQSRRWHHEEHFKKNKTCSIANSTQAVNVQYKNRNQCTYLGSRVILWISLTAELAAYKEIFLICIVDDGTREVFILFQMVSIMYELIVRHIMTYLKHLQFCSMTIWQAADFLGHPDWLWQTLRWQKIKGQLDRRLNHFNRTEDNVNYIRRWSTY